MGHNKRGLFVVFLGPDGSGKTSVIDRMLLESTPVFMQTIYIHLRPRLGINKSHSAIVTDPHKESPRGMLLSMGKLIYLLFDYGIGYLFKVKPLLIKSTLIVFDRYYYDLLIDPIRYRYGAPIWFARIVGKFIPKPDLIILLDAPPEVLQSRKQEVPFAETQRQRDAYLQYVHAVRNGVVIDASQPLTQVVQSTREVILKFLAKRAQKRCNLL